MAALGAEHKCWNLNPADPHYQNLSPAAQALLEDTSFRDRVATCFGATRVNPTNLQKEAMSEISRLGKTSSAEYLAKQLRSLGMILRSGRNLNFAYQRTVENYNVGQPGNPLQLLSEQDFNALFSAENQNRGDALQNLDRALGLREPVRSDPTDPREADQNA
ncbi:hypothetical protein COW36_15920 [bacterium (Candidatus Blackallbacteria) CG17_big_fil_post_rev_8_21_14_2_50_48_46]|uniref:Uncharacterized protein n=1 Tax=bacterium (Candidatus Blackallbacteria) CG17_big_fil_post_rev_8_21_14_2_50_48_46 TaxID=2014261 RepID=A0A2M7G1W3_9BACT|nr:MAG: hypothetical protein COW64_09070 [bacterium (Candidatus Blackallbacteria) CG18_big_fil_WC_8_21_14_2_50_49_26]PIW15755.1 MAG: hypothetical protein COW36_15920 [bacterium (Candidatus Blackallbacteria) CG17_big_fil_post_rev_8_21_14_2_50_48_46]PIW48747.1 MAG: hypothetical protein COW20_08335 [bacterium (Candidatus Blackallbacteria) CG13_big_fil_rev_8_21_14_2_50_49_14]